MLDLFVISYFIQLLLLYVISFLLRIYFNNCFYYTLILHYNYKPVNDNKRKMKPSLPFLLLTNALLPASATASQAPPPPQTDAYTLDYFQKVGACFLYTGQGGDREKAISPCKEWCPAHEGKDKQGIGVCSTSSFRWCIDGIICQMLIIPVLHPRNNNPRRPRPQHLPQRRARPRIHPREMSLREPPEVPPPRGAGHGLAVEAGRYSLRGVPGEFQDDRHVWAEYCFWERTGGGAADDC